jgi:hypothetical protein
MSNDKGLSVAVCCREWKVFAAMPIGKCGLCGEVPKLEVDKG